MKYLFLFLLAAGVLFAAVDCSPHFNETITVQVLDAQFRSVQGAGVQIYYQLKYTFGKEYVYTKKVITDSQGYAKLVVNNIEPDPQKVDCNLLIIASYDGKNETKTIVAQKHAKITGIQLQLHPVSLRITDQFNSPIENAEVWVNSESGITSKNGYVDLYAYKGDAKILVKYGEGRLEETLEIINDTVKTLGLNLYPMTINLLDDMGKKLDGTVVIGLNEFQTENGTLTVKKLATETPKVTVKYKNAEINLDVDLSLKKNYDVIFDQTAPEIIEIKTLDAEDYTKLIVRAADSGIYATGISSVKAGYKIEGSTGWSEVPSYISGKNEYAVEIPFQENKIVKFFVKVEDRQGNSQQSEGQYFSAGKSPPQNTSGSQTQNDPSSDKKDEFPLMWVVGSILIVAVVIYLIYRFKSAQNRGEG